MATDSKAVFTVDGTDDHRKTHGRIMLDDCCLGNYKFEYGTNPRYQVDHWRAILYPPDTATSRNRSVRLAGYTYKDMAETVQKWLDGGGMTGDRNDTAQQD